MIKYEVGKEFPITTQNKNGFRILTNEAGSFDVVGYISTPSTREVREFKQGILRIGYITYDSIPFVLIQNETIEVDCPYNAFLIDNTKFKEWCDTDYCIVNMFLVDSDTDILKAIRAVEVGFMKDLKRTLKSQLLEYNNHLKVNTNVDNIYGKVTLLDMLKATKLEVFIK